MLETSPEKLLILSATIEAGVPKFPLNVIVPPDELVWLNVCIKRIVLEQTVRPALELAKNLIGSKGRDEDGQAIEASDGEAMELMAAGFIQDPNNQAAAELGEENV